MSRLKHTISNLSKNKLVKARVLEVLGDKIAVQLVSNGTKLFGLPYTGGPTSAGKYVYVDYSSGAPIVQVRGEQALYVAPVQKSGSFVRTEFPQAQIGGPGGTGLIPEHLHEVRGSVIFTAEGLLTQGENPLHIYNDSGETRTLTKVLLVVEAGPVGTSIIVDIHKNGTTIFTTQANRPSIPVGQTGGFSVLIDDTVWDNGDYITMHIDQVGSSQPGTYLTVQVVYSTNTLDVYGLMGMTLDGLTDVATTNPQDGDALVYESGVGQWVNSPTSGAAHAYAHEDGGADEIDVTGLSGVLANRQDANKLQGRDIQDHAPEDAEVLKWVAGNSRWEPGSAIGGLDNLTDAVITTPSDNQVLAYDTSSGFWINHSPVELGVKSQALFTLEGGLVITTGGLRIYNQMGATKTIVEVFLSAGTAPTGAAIIVDVNKNGTTIFTNQANRPQIAASSNTGGTTQIDVPSWADGDYLTMDLDQAGSTIPGSNLTVHIVYY